MKTHTPNAEDGLWPLLERFYDGVLLVRADNWHVLCANHTAARWLGQTPEELVGRLALELFLEESREAVVTQFERELAAGSSDGPIIVKLLPTQRRKRTVGLKACRIVWDGEAALGVWLHSVQTPARYFESMDPLVRWKDRAFLETRLGELLHDYDPPKKFVLLFIDLDNFKAVNDRHGHIWGDRVLKAIAWQLAECVGEGELVARYGGDEFLVLVENQTDSTSVEALANRIRRAVSTPMVVPGETISLTASMGIAYAAPEYCKVEDVLAAADRAMYAAKRGNR